MPTKKGKSKPAKASKTSTKQRRAPKKGVTRRAGTTPRVSTGRVTATGDTRAAGTAARTGAIKGANPKTAIMPRREGDTDQKATGGRGIVDGGERVRI